MSESSQQTPVRGVSYLYMAAAFVVVVFGMRAGAAIVNPLLLAIFLSVISAPAYFGLLKRGVSNWLSLATVIGVLSVVMVTAVLLVMESIAGFTSRHEHYRDLLDERTAVIQKKIDDLIPDWARVNQNDEDTDDAESKEEADDTEGADSPQAADTSESVVSPSGPDEMTRDESPPNAVDPPNKDENTVPSLADESSADATDEGSDADGNEADGEPLTEGSSEEPASPLESITEVTLVENPNADSVNLIPSPVRRTFTFESHEPDPPTTLEGWKDLILEQFNPGMLISFAVNIAGSIGQLLSRTFLILLTVIFILLEAGTFGRKMTEAFARSDSATKGREIVQSIHDYIVIKTWLSLATGVLIAVWLKIVGVPYAGLWGLLAFLLNFIPNVGSIIAAIPAVLIAWLELTTLPAVACGIGFLLVNMVIGNFVEPRLMGKGLGLSPLVVFCSMVFWGWVLGPVGMLLSVPLTMTARIAFEGFEDTKWLATLMGNAE